MNTEYLPVIEVAKMDSVVKADELANVIASAIKSGYVNPLEVLVRRKLIEKAFEAAFDEPDVKNIVANELALHPKEKATVLGAEISMGSRTTMEYKEDPRYAQIQADLKRQEELVKAATKTGANIVDDDGELLASPVPTKTSSYFTVKLPK